MEQSKLFWSRLQTIAAIQTGVLVGWYKLPTDEQILKKGILILGLILSLLIAFIMRRDRKYMEKMHERAKPEFPEPDDCPDAPKGRDCAYAMLVVMMIADLILLIC